MAAPVLLSLFAGIGGFEAGFARAGFHGHLVQYDNWAAAQTVLQRRFPSGQVFNDVGELPADLHGASILTAGFPCTDLSQAGKTAGLSGDASGLIIQVLRLLAEAVDPPEWVLLENVPNLLALNGGAEMAVVLAGLEQAGYSWAYRVLDAQRFGVAQRRRRVYILAARYADPRRVLFRDIPGAQIRHRSGPGQTRANGFYWTEGNRGIGWGHGVVPTIKGSTTVRVPSPPAVWRCDRRDESAFFTPSIEALERLQGFRSGWTADAPERDRWKLVGNAVAVPVAAWIARGLLAIADAPKSVGDSLKMSPVVTRAASHWGTAGFGGAVTGTVTAMRLPEGMADRSAPRRQSLASILDTYGSTPLSRRAARGFRDRLFRSSLHPNARFREAIDVYAGQPRTLIQAEV
jgi:DNA (cytosine-5)-methyltransferase 1